MSNVKKLEFAEGTDVGAPTDLGIQTSTTSVNEYPDDAAFVSANGSAEDGDMYLNTTTRKIRYYLNSAWRNAVPESDSSDPTKKIEFDLTGATTGTTATIDINNTASRTYTMQDEAGTIPVLPIVLTSEVSGALPIANGGTGQTGATAAFDALAPTTTKGDLIAHDGTDNVRLAAGANGLVLTADSGAASGLSWQAVTPSLDAYSDQINLSIACSVGSNALTIALKDKAGSDPSAGSPVKIGFRNSTLTNGTYNVRSVTGALSLVISSGSTLGHSSAVQRPIYVYAIDNAGTVELAVSSSLLDSFGVVSTTAEGGAGAADSGSAIYSTTARSNVPIRLIARLLSTQTTAGTWAAVPTETSIVGGWAGFGQASTTNVGLGYLFHVVDNLSQSSLTNNTITDVSGSSILDVSPGSYLMEWGGGCSVDITSAITAAEVTFQLRDFSNVSITNGDAVSTITNASGTLARGNAHRIQTVTLTSTTSIKLSCIINVVSGGGTVSGRSISRAYVKLTRYA